MAAQRQDGRGAQEQRLPSFRLRALSSPAGSAYAEGAEAKLLCAVYGPHQAISEFDELCRVRVSWTVTAFAEGAYRDAAHRYDDLSVEDRSMVISLEQALENTVLTERYPKSVIDVNFVVVQRGGMELPLALMTACLALADAGVALRDLVTAASASCLRTPDGGFSILADPSAAEIAKCGNNILMAHHVAEQRVVTVAQRGVMRPDQVEAAIKQCTASCGELHQHLRQVLRELTREVLDVETEASQAESMAREHRLKLAGTSATGSAGGGS
eukprot:TRINITY_DN15382_c0_g1_i1.p1 TRINITY_DN15382_c0_g1~~TRINITY_DN15382_c0_g1_i1.p1  ORF type:complete len:298 (+),score=105.46 TRINITY_DN15382_c0_g1_i1:82-894(+)